MSHEKDDLEALVARVGRLEVQNRRWKLASTLLLLFGVSLAVLGAKPAEPSVARASTVEAQEFILKDAEGHVHARLSLPPSNPASVGKTIHKGRLYLFSKPQVLREATLQFYDDKDQVIWTAPPTPTAVPATR